MKPTQRNTSRKKSQRRFNDGVLQQSAMLVGMGAETSIRKRFARSSSGLSRSMCVISLATSVSTCENSVVSITITSGDFSFCACVLPGWITGRNVRRNC